MDDSRPDGCWYHCVIILQVSSCQLCGSSRLLANNKLSDKQKKEILEGPDLADFIEASLNGENVGENIVQKRGERWVYILDMHNSFSPVF